MFCPKCGTKALDGAGFCQKCGTKLMIVEDTTAQPASRSPAAVPKERRFRIPFIILAILFAFIVILVAANADNLAKKEEQAQRDEEYIESQQQSLGVNTDVGYAADQLLCNDISVDTIMEMSAEDIIPLSFL